MTCYSEYREKKYNCKFLNKIINYILHKLLFNSLHDGR